MADNDREVLVVDYRWWLADNDRLIGAKRQSSYFPRRNTQASWPFGCSTQLGRLETPFGRLVVSIMEFYACKHPYLRPFRSSGFVMGIGMDSLWFRGMQRFRYQYAQV